MLLSQGTAEPTSRSIGDASYLNNGSITSAHFILNCYFVVSQEPWQLVFTM